MNYAIEFVVDMKRSEKSSYPKTFLNLAIEFGERLEKLENSINNIIKAILNIESLYC